MALKRESTNGSKFKTKFNLSKILQYFFLNENDLQHVESEAEMKANAFTNSNINDKNLLLASTPIRIGTYLRA